MGSATLAFPWETTPLGPISSWGPALRQVVRTCFSTRFPVLIAWGPELTMIYNDGYRDMLGSQKRLTALGAPMAQVWEEIWGDIGPMVDQVMTTRKPIWVVDAPLLMNRSGFDEETYFTFSYSPLVDDDEEIAGILDIATETTEQVITRRQLLAIDALHAALHDAGGSRADMAQAAVALLRTSPDLARCAVLVKDAPTGVLTVAGDYGLVSEVPDDLVDQVLATRKAAVHATIVLAPLLGSDHGEADGILLAQAPTVRPFDAVVRSFVMLTASAITGALRAATTQEAQVAYHDARARVLELENERTQESSLVLQESMLTAPPEPDHLHVVVRYHPAADDLAVGGDWYDAFLTKDGAITLVVGDVTGHDHRAAATMGQLRGLIRAIAYDSGVGPAGVLERADDAIAGLNLGSGATATAVLARIEQTDSDAHHGKRTVRWTNAGHPYPIIVRAGGTVEVLARKNDLLLGIVPQTRRTEHTIDIDNGDTLFIYTDGLIERRHTEMRQSMDVLVAALEDAHLKPLEELANHILATLTPERVDDDVAFVLVRPFPEDQPRPAEAGPNQNIPAPLK